MTMRRSQPGNAAGSSRSLQPAERAEVGLLRHVLRHRGVAQDDAGDGNRHRLRRLDHPAVGVDVAGLRQRDQFAQSGHDRFR